MKLLNPSSMPVPIIQQHLNQHLQVHKRALENHINLINSPGESKPSAEKNFRSSKFNN
jgi:hypothetical protein